MHEEESLVMHHSRLSCCRNIFFQSLFFLLGSNALAQVPLPNARPVPRMQVAPQSQDQVSIQQDGRELTRYHYGASQRRPFLFPVNGPAGRSLTRLGNIHDPHGHRHHNSVWIAHHDVNGVNFWTDEGAGQIVHRRALRFLDGKDVALLEMQNEWIDDSGSEKVLLKERRQMEFFPLADRQWLLIVHLHLEPVDEAVTLGKTPFGLFGVRVATSLSVQDGGGTIRNSERSVDEKAIMGQRARWVDYSGPITSEGAEGVTLMDHPANPRHPTRFHVRDDGWMGASFTFDAPHSILLEKPLRLCYGLLVHRGVPTHRQLEQFYQRFVAATHEGDTQPAPLNSLQKKVPLVFN